MRGPLSLLVLLVACTDAADADVDTRPPRDDGGAASDGGAADGGAAGDGGSDGGAGDGGDGGAVDAVEPPFDDSSGGSGGQDAPSSDPMSAGGTDYLLLAPTGSASGRALCLLVVISGTEGASGMMSNMRQVAPYYGLEDCLIAVLDGTRSDAADAAVALDDVREQFDVDNDRTWMMSESAGTGAGLELAFELRPTWFAAVWFNDVNDQATASQDAEALGFAPWGNAGPGGDLPDANRIVDGMDAAGYQLPSDAPYSGAGSTTHGSSEQFLAAVDFFADKER